MSEIGMRKVLWERKDPDEKEDFRVYGTIQYGHIPLHKNEKVHVEKEIHGYIVSHGSLEADEEVQYWVNFKRADPTRPVTCKVEIFTRNALWESAGVGHEPMQAFTYCMNDLKEAYLKAS